MLKEEYIFLDTELSDKNEVLKFISQKAKDFNITDHQEELYQDFLNREKEFSTGLQDGFAIPHARSNHVKKIAIMFIRNRSIVNEWETLDGSKVKYMFALLVPKENEGNVHLQMISKLATCLLEDDFKEKVASSNSNSELKEFILNMIKEG
ncbi:MAG: PTS sugar transporter subunit IIA [Erysipelotrichia bacterium]|nr:PTS sugar transporter subunit IIA [Erysipelotrichia bacterium]NCC54012.1 PTS sugar transporter subunit IIA [Erysipelotrichia bacterium]